MEGRWYLVAQKNSVLPDSKKNRNSKGQFQKALICPNGHDTSDLESLASGGRCRICRRAAHRTPEYRYRKMKRELGYKIRDNQQRVAELEKELLKYEQKISDRAGESQSN